MRMYRSEVDDCMLGSLTVLVNGWSKYTLGHYYQPGRVGDA